MIRRLKMKGENQVVIFGRLSHANANENTPYIYLQTVLNDYLYIKRVKTQYSFDQSVLVGSDDVGTAPTGQNFGDNQF